MGSPLGACLLLGLRHVSFRVLGAQQVGRHHAQELDSPEDHPWSLPCLPLAVQCFGLSKGTSPFSSRSQEAII